MPRFGLKNIVLYFGQFHLILLHSTVLKKEGKKMKNTEITKDFFQIVPKCSVTLDLL